MLHDCFVAIKLTSTSLFTKLGWVFVVILLGLNSDGFF